VDVRAALQPWPTLLERAREVKSPAAGEPAASSSSYVLYWMRTAMRAHENPALSAAIAVANALELPLLVCLSLSDRCANATARRHTFILEGARSVVKELSERGIASCVHVERRGRRAPLVRTLAFRSRVVITDEPFVEPYLSELRALAEGTSFAAPVWAIDSACIVPARLVRAADAHRAYAFEKATSVMRRARLLAGVPEIEYGARGAEPATPVPPLPLDTDEDIAAIVADTEADPSVAAVLHTRGGSASGYARWTRFDAKRYAKTRNDATALGVSRMSAYINLGMVSPFRLAQEASGSAKFINEFAVWRELSYAHCFHHPRTYARLEGLPQWAQNTLRAHAADRRPRIVPLEELEQAKSGDKHWDAMQESLVRNGELHNNCRMHWGKALLKWSATPEDALARLVRLNDRFALDGCAPPSYGGIMWSLGMFDGPKEETPIYGRVRRRDGARLDLTKFRACIDALERTRAKVLV